MNQPTEGRFKQFEERQAEFEKRLRDVERHTAPIKITQLEIDSGGIHRRFDEAQEDTNALKIQMEGVRADVSAIRATQSDHTAFLVEHSQRLKEIEDKQETHTELLGQLINVGEELKTTMATKDDIARIERESAKRFDKLEAMMMQILERLPKAEGE